MTYLFSALYSMRLWKPIFLFIWKPSVIKLTFDVWEREIRILIRPSDVLSMSLSLSLSPYIFNSFMYGESESDEENWRREKGVLSKGADAFAYFNLAVACGCWQQILGLMVYPMTYSFSSFWVSLWFFLFLGLGFWECGIPNNPNYFIIIVVQSE